MQEILLLSPCIITVPILFLRQARPRVLRHYAPEDLLQRLAADSSDHVKVHRNSQRSNTSHYAHSISTSIRSHLSALVQGSHHDEVEDHDSVDEPVPHIINSTTLSHLFHTGGRSWKPGSFCHDFLERRFHTPVQVCGEGTKGAPQIKCFWNPQNAHAATCDIENIMVRPYKLWDAMENVQGTFPHSGSVRLLENEDFSCHHSSINK